MTLPASGQISLSQVNTELGRASNTAINMNESAVRTLAGVGGSGTGWGMNSLYGKSSLSAFGTSDDGGTFDSSMGAGTAAATPSVTPSGGTGSYTYSWSFTFNPNGATLSLATNQTCQVSKTYGSNSAGSFSATLQCVVSSGGSSVTVSNITASASWST